MKYRPVEKNNPERVARANHLQCVDCGTSGFIPDSAKIVSGINWRQRPSIDVEEVIEELCLHDGSKMARFETAVLQHLDAAHNLARWLTHNDAVAEDAVQDACIRAFRFFDGMQGASPKAWFMAIVRNACMDCLREQKRNGSPEEFDETQHTMDDAYTSAALGSPERNALRNAETREVHAAIAGLPVEYREVIVLRELEDMSYKEISGVVKIPIGTVMSRLARGRDLLRDRLHTEKNRAAS